MGEANLRTHRARPCASCWAEVGWAIYGDGVGALPEGSAAAEVVRGRLPSDTWHFAVEHDVHVASTLPECPRLTPLRPRRGAQSREVPDVSHFAGGNASASVPEGEERS